MFSRLCPPLITIPVVIISLWSTTLAPAAEPRDIVKPLLDESTVAVVGIKTETLQPGPLRSVLLHMLPQGDAVAAHMVARADALYTALRQAEVEEIYLVFSLSDRFQDLPYVVLPEIANADAAAIAEQLQRWQFGDLRFRKVHDAIVFGTMATLDRLESLDASPPVTFDAASQSVGDAAFWAVLMASDDQRRVIEAMRPELPEAVGGGDLQILARGAAWIGLAVHTSPDAAVRLVAQSTDADSAAAVQRWIKQLLESLKQHPQVADDWPGFVEHIDALTPKLAASQLRWDFDLADDSLRGLIGVVARPLRQILVDQARRQASDDLKKLALAMHNYHDAHGHFPPAGSTDPQGRPLLSWRVLLLPYLDEAELYREFHLDEPWDSQHNRRLIPRMPLLYWVPLSRHLPRDGRSNYAVPGGEQTIFPPGGPTAFRDLEDGSSNTIMIMEVDDDHADVWTKPGAHVVNVQQPAAGLGGHFDGTFLIALGDGAVRALPRSLPAETLRILFTRDGGEAMPSIPPITLFGEPTAF